MATVLTRDEGMEQGVKIFLNYLNGEFESIKYYLENKKDVLLILWNRCYCMLQE